MSNNHVKLPDAQQNEICSKYSILPQLPDGHVAVALGTLGLNPIYGTRIKLPENGTISWFFYCGEHSEVDDFYQAIHTQHLQQELPEVIKYLYLPEGSKFIIDREGYEDVWFEK